MIFNLLLWSLIFIIFYEILPETLCRLDGEELKHFAGTVQCNGIAESTLLLLVVVILAILMFKIDKKRMPIALMAQTSPSNVLKILALISTIITFASTIFLWSKTGFAIIPDSSSRATLVLLYHSVFGSPLVSPFLYFSIVTSTYLYAVHEKKALWAICSASIIFGCYITMSRGFILSVLLPYIVTQRPAKFIRFVPFMLLLFFLRDILNGSFFSYLQSDSEALSISVDAFGEFTNTYFGRRYLIDNNIDGDYVIYFIENIIKVSGLYYLCLPLVKMFATMGIELPSSTLSLNDSIQGSLGLTGFAGSFLSDLVIFFPFSFVFILFGVVLMSIFLKRTNDVEQVFFFLIAAMLLPNAFRWSVTSYMAMLSGVCMAYLTLKAIVCQCCYNNFNRCPNVHNITIKK